MPLRTRRTAGGDREAFRAGFQRSAKGNLWRRHPVGGGEVTVTVFRRLGRYAFCVHRPEGLRYSPGTYATEEEALDALWHELPDPDGEGPC